MALALIPVLVSAALGFMLTHVSNQELQKARLSKGLRAYVSAIQ